MSDDPKLPNSFGFKKRTPEQREKMRRSLERAGRISDALNARIPGGRDNPELHREFYRNGGLTPSESETEDMEDEKG